MKGSKPLISLILLGLSLTACGKAVAPEESKAPEAVLVGVVSAANSRTAKSTLTFPALVAAEAEADIIAKSAGTVQKLGFALGDQVVRGTPLITVDDVGTGAGTSANTLGAAQVRQASVAVDQAAASLRLAEQNYSYLLNANASNLDLLAIARDQAVTGSANLGTVTGETEKSAQLALETANTAVELAKTNLDNRQAIAGQGAADAATNAQVAADAAADGAQTVIVAMNNLFAFDENGTVAVPYKSNLGASDPDTVTRATGGYKAAKQANDAYLAAQPPDIRAQLDAAFKLATAAKELADATRLMLDRSVTSVTLPLNPGPAGGASLSGLQGAVSGFQSQLTGLIAQVNGAKQTLDNTGLNNQATVDSLTKAYELAQEQQKQAAQALASVKAGNKSQTDSSAFGVSASESQFKSQGIQLEITLAAAKSQVDLAGLAYRNAQIALQNAYDSHVMVAPLSGKVTKKFAGVGDTVSYGQLLATVSDPDSAKLTFYIDKDNLPFLKLGQAAEIRDGAKVAAAGRVSAISAAADNQTKRFAVDVKPDSAENFIYALGTVMDVAVTVERSPSAAGNLLVPVSALTIGQNQSSLFTVKDGKAAKADVTVVGVVGEMAEIKADLAPETLIVVGNSKLLQEGEGVATTTTEGN